MLIRIFLNSFFNISSRSRVLPFYISHLKTVVKKFCGSEIFLLFTFSNVSASTYATTEVSKGRRTITFKVQSKAKRNKKEKKIRKRLNSADQRYQTLHRKKTVNLLKINRSQAYQQNKNVLLAFGNGAGIKKIEFITVWHSAN